jgi:hypothetical protein
MIPLRRPQPAVPPPLDDSSTEDLTYVARAVNADQIITDALRRYSGQRGFCDVLLDIRNALRPPAATP